ncbi:Retron-type reverse transcriptase [Paenibacillus thiaminolyticus]|uniref:Retron-type reverse transcriptase n=2 Tax=Paenibacillus thiaminolyticus TaxID=49283 RepID=A0A3A3GE32_PANTH|nr:Retron-type reverse transcriptase [Paenibacillus thiaminolyticus]
MMLTKDSINWAIDFIQNHSDGDLFPRILEINAISSYIDDFVALIEGKDLTQFTPGACRRFIVPKDEISYRQATQLDPQDSIILTSIIHQFGSGIEARRLHNNIVYSYRFSPDISHGLYSSKTAWNDFWKTAYEKSRTYEFVLYCDIADYYNQIYHHIVENQLHESGFPNQETKWIIKLLNSTTANVSRGIPIGPHAVHLLAEAAMIPIDNSLHTQGIDFLRYADDILVFCDSSQSAKIALAKIASILDKQQRLMLQRHKTKVYSSNDFRHLCNEMIEDRPINKDEDKILKLIRKYSNGDPYRTITYSEISKEDWESLTDQIIGKIIREYIDQKEVDYIRLRWFYRRLAQIGHPGAIEISLSNISQLSPCFANICAYLASIQSISAEQWVYIGEQLLKLLDSQEVVHNEFFRLSILSLFTKNEYINHFSYLVNKFPVSEPFARREILLAAYQNSAYDWLREQKENYQSMDPWQKMAFIYGVSGLPKDEKRFFLNSLTHQRPFDSVLIKWAKNI